MATQFPTADTDYVEHAQFYRSFLRGVMTAIALAATVLILLAAFLL